MKKKITVSVNGTPVSAYKDMLISEIRNMEKPCGGRAKCGKCKIFADGILSEQCEDEKRMLSLLTEEDVEPFSHAPFRIGRKFGEALTAHELHANPTFTDYYTAGMIFEAVDG